jgi:hypothetical protein
MSFHSTYSNCIQFTSLKSIIRWTMDWNRLPTYTHMHMSCQVATGPTNNNQNSCVIHIRVSGNPPKIFEQCTILYMYCSDVLDLLSFYLPYFFCSMVFYFFFGHFNFFVYLSDFLLCNKLSSFGILLFYMYFPSCQYSCDVFIFLLLRCNFYLIS